MRSNYCLLQGQKARHGTTQVCREDYRHMAFLAKQYERPEAVHTNSLVNTFSVSIVSTSPRFGTLSACKVISIISLCWCLM